MAEARTWTSVDGRKVEAEFVDLKGGKLMPREDPDDSQAAPEGGSVKKAADPKKKGKIPYRTFKKMLRDSMGACLPDYVIRADDHLPPAIEEKMHELRKAQGAELWTRMHVGDVCVRTDAEGYKHMALVRGLTDISITVQDIYTLDNALGWTQGGDNCFTYELKTHPDIGERILPPAPGDDTFDDALERFLMLSADNDGDGEITLKEFRHFVRRRVSKGEPSPYAAFLTLQRKLRKVGNLGDEFWDQRGLELVIMMEKAGLWSAKELHRHVILKKVIRRPPVKYGGEVDVQPPEKKEKKAKGVKNVDKAPPMPCLLYTSPSPRDKRQSRMPSSA